MSEKKPGRRKGEWNADYIREVQAQLRAKLASLGAGAQEKIAHLTSQLGDNAKEKSDAQRYVHAVSALALNNKVMLLTEREEETLLLLAKSLLKVHRVPETSHPNSFLHEDLSLIESQRHRRYGHHWLAAWTHEAAARSSVDQVERQVAYGIGRAIRMFRIGYCQQAVELFQTLRPSVGSSAQGALVDLNLLKLFRLTGEFAKANTIEREIRGYAHQLENHEDIEGEVEWEKALRERPADSMVRSVLNLLGRTGPLRKDVGYIGEAFLWSAIQPSLESLKKARPPRAATKQIAIPKREKLFLKCCCAIQDCYDYDIPLDRRISSLGQVLGEAEKLLSLDRELLVLAAASRWLARSRLPLLETLVRLRYRDLSVRISSGKSIDILEMAIPD